METVPLRLVVFDVDGTLVDSQAHILAAMAEAYGALDMVPPRREEVLSIVGLSLPVAMERLAPRQPAEVHDTLVRGYKDAFARLRQSDGGALSPLFPGAREVLDGLFSLDEVLVGLATGKSRRGLSHVLELHGLADAFATLQVADDHPSKPNPSMLLSALRETGTEAANAVMIGDTTFDIEMGRAAGFATIGVGWGYHAAEALEEAGAEEVVAHIAELPAAIERIWEAS